MRNSFLSIFPIGFMLGVSLMIDRMPAIKVKSIHLSSAISIIPESYRQEGYTVDRSISPFRMGEIIPFATSPIVKVAVGEYKVDYLLANGDVYTWSCQNMHKLTFGTSSKAIDIADGFNDGVIIDTDRKAWHHGNDCNNPVSYLDAQGNQFDSVASVVSFWKNHVFTLIDSSAWAGFDGFNTDVKGGYFGTNAYAPIKISTSQKFKKLAAGIALVGLTYNGQVWEWGYKTGSSTPIQKTLPGTGIAIDVASSANNWRGCIVKQAGSAGGDVCLWGNDFGYWNGNTDYSQPTSFTSAWGLSQAFREINMNSNTIHIVDTANRLYGAGASSSSEIGNGSSGANKYNYPTRYQYSLEKQEQVITPPVLILTNVDHVFSGNCISFSLYATLLNTKLMWWGTDKALASGRGYLNLQEANYRNALDAPLPIEVSPQDSTFKTFNLTLPSLDAGSNLSFNTSSQTLSGTVTPLYFTRANGGVSTPTKISDTIVSVQWIQASGPVATTIASPNSLNTAISGLTAAGVYKYYFIATDNRGGNQRDSVIMTRTGSSPQTNFYFANNGSDGNDGTIGSPWSSLAKFQSILAARQPGDSIFFKAGDEFTYLTDRLYVGDLKGAFNNYIYVGRYGTGIDPVLTPMKKITSWISDGNGLYHTSAAILSDSLKCVSFNNVQLPPAGYANDNSIIVDSVINKGGSPGVVRLYSTALIGAPDLVNSQAVTQHERYDIHKSGRVTNQGYNWVEYLWQNGGYPNPGYAVEFRYVKSRLTANGRWTWINGVLHIYSDHNPNTDDWRFAVSDQFFYITPSTRYVTFENLTFKGANAIIVHGSARDINLNKIKYRMSGSNYAFFDGDGGNVNITNSQFDSCWGNSLSVFNKDSCTVSNNLFRDNGTLCFGLNNPDQGGKTTVFMQGTKNTFSYNTLLRNVYTGLAFGGDAGYVFRNMVDGFCSDMDDGAAYYDLQPVGGAVGYGPLTIWEENFALNGIRLRYRSLGLYWQAYGYYWDDNARKGLLKKNFALRIAEAMFELHNTDSITLEGNIGVHMGEAGAYLHGDRSGEAGIRQLKGLKLINNEFVTDSLATIFRSAQNTYAQNGINTGNYYVTNKLYPFEVTTNLSNRLNYNMAGLTGLGRETGSTLRTHADYDTVFWNYSASPDIRSFTGTKRDKNGIPYTNSITVAPYSAVVLYKSFETVLDGIRFNLRRVRTINQ